ncbi:maleylpyruvate isomerase family mycothiol-dependent enzyme [Actinomadura rubrisoli]|uniref:Maleylpyruvate isomerase family mycothiol-dependent enzyme n=1 Tax=Actinomadura rubrisoli TaxID=2530368 RepID=A0A4R5B833_9ACTN|nr:maleylpyruvate isomerase family mycothiol-dependent enzyme [Actinomadura rubrisoli]TDD81243.1 maleylpyruvate isomerase family mycothiol-dependent enzyme [Actinomadura rubrisoli]
MRPVHEHVASLLGAWALGACSDEETQLVMDHLAHCSDCMEESLLLGGVADLLGGTTPRSSLRERTLTSARARRPAAPSVPYYAAPYAALVSMLDGLLAELPMCDWSTTVIYDWNVQDVLAHLSATDALLLQQLEAGAQDLDVDARTALEIARERRRKPSETRTAWRDQAETLCVRLGEDKREDTQVVNLRYPLRLKHAAVARAFETWIHARDIASATGRSLPSPLPDHLHTIASLGVRALPAALELYEGRPADGDSLHIDLSGPGGGTWDLPLGPQAPPTPTVTLALDTMDFCLLAADRIKPTEVQAEFGGDTALARRLLTAASIFAGP